MMILYQFESCPFCWKVKALLHFAKIPYQAIEVNPMNSKELEPLGLKKVPVLVDGDNIITESSVIMDYVNTQYAHLESNDAANEWRAWVDSSLVHFLPPIIYKDFSTAWQTFGLVLRTSGYGAVKRPLVRFAGALAMSRVAIKKARERGITNAPQGLTEAVLHWVNDGLAGKPFHGGNTPDLADLSVFGVFRSTDGLAAVVLARAASPVFTSWYDALKARTQPTSA